MYLEFSCGNIYQCSVIFLQVKSSDFYRNPMYNWTFCMRVKGFAIALSWSCRFTSSTNRKLLGLKVASV